MAGIASTTLPSTTLRARTQCKTWTSSQINVQHPITLIPRCRQYLATPAATADGSAASTPNDPSPSVQSPTTTGDVGTPSTSHQNTGLFARIKRFFTGEKMDRERLKALGLGAVASYGMLSNLVYCTGAVVDATHTTIPHTCAMHTLCACACTLDVHMLCMYSIRIHMYTLRPMLHTGMAVTWVIFVKQRGVSPLAAGQWGAYLAFYAGFWTINNLYACLCCIACLC